ncbi:helix-turn-helix domain-containing protein [Roseibium sp. RKSG952]|uniref:helix-turn-helix domain-containing protein n=1 Tax=Roseibium sp. RKSG952 TaxID=2529384 RepID=UPI0018AD2A82|nr:helix-turn-helix domain-containing protein [Roseibium sp. RKSG952]
MPVNNSRNNENDARTYDLIRSVFDTSLIETAGQYEVWRESISCIFDTEAQREPIKNGFPARIEATRFNTLLFSKTICPAQKWTRTPLRIAADGMDHLMIQLYKRGEHTWQKNDNDIDLPKGGLLVFDLSQETRAFTTDSENLSVIIPKSLFADRINLSLNYHMKILYPNNAINSLLYNHLLDIDRISQIITPSEACHIAPSTVGLLASCLNMGVEFDDPAQKPAIDSAVFRRITSFIDVNLCNMKLNAKYISENIGVSRSGLYRIFNRFGGVENYIKKRRLDDSFRVLSDPSQNRRKILDVAFDAGYNTHSSFCKAFKNQFNISPQELRKNNFAKERGYAIDIAVDRTYERWLHSMN